MDNIAHTSRLKISAFRAVDNIDACRKYIAGHIHVLKVYGITQITSARIDWILNPYVYVILVESTETGEVLGGARIQVAGGDHALPIEEAIGMKDDRIHAYVDNLKAGGTGEFCGLWNSRKIAGMGIGSMFLGRTSIAVVDQLNIKTLLGLCAPSTKRNSFRIGFKVEESLGNKGEFIYPKENLVATCLIIPDTKSLIHADPTERDFIMGLRSNPTQLRVESTRRGDIEIDYDLKIPHIVVPDMADV